MNLVKVRQEPINLDQVASGLDGYRAVESHMSAMLKYMSYLSAVCRIRSRYCIGSCRNQVVDLQAVFGRDFELAMIKDLEVEAEERHRSEEAFLGSLAQAAEVEIAAQVVG